MIKPIEFSGVKNIRDLSRGAQSKTENGKRGGHSHNCACSNYLFGDLMA